ncbi:MAG: hypothetical protein LKJ76_00050 [Lachnospiraceae bacterium]|jgi:YD repeat-containing protein|nr:hypothetical protein [Lachnospiraceae bacterium]
MKKSGMHSRTAALCFGLIAGIALTMAQGGAVYAKTANSTKKAAAKTVYLETKATNYGSDGKIYGYDNLQYDAAGNNISLTSTDEKGNISSITLTTYDVAGRKTAQSYSYYEDGAISETDQYTFQYDAAGRLSVEFFMKGSHEGYHEFQYDAAGNMIHDYYHIPEGDLLQHDSRNFDYDTRGNAIRQYWFDEDGKTVLDMQTLVCKNTYNKAGRRTREKWYDFTGFVVSDTGYAYDKAGNCIKETHYNSDGEVIEYIVYQYAAFRK